MSSKRVVILNVPRSRRVRINYLYKVTDPLDSLASPCMVVRLILYIYTSCLQASPLKVPSQPSAGFEAQKTLSPHRLKIEREYLLTPLRTGIKVSFLPSLFGVNAFGT